MKRTGLKEQTRGRKPWVPGRRWMWGWLVLVLCSNPSLASPFDIWDC